MSTLASQAVLAGEPDFTRMRTFEAHYAYLDVPHGAPAQDRFAIHAERRGGGWIVEAVGSNPKIAASVSICRKRFFGRTLGPRHLRATDPSGEFGSFELQREGAYVRLVSLSTGDCARHWLPRRQVLGAGPMDLHTDGRAMIDQGGTSIRMMRSRTALRLSSAIPLCRRRSSSLATAIRCKSIIAAIPTWDLVSCGIVVIGPRLDGRTRPT